MKIQTKAGILVKKKLKTTVTYNFNEEIILHMYACLPAGCRRTRQAAMPHLRGLGAEGVGTEVRYGSSHQPAPSGDVDVHLRGSWECLT